jgi:hypothetical protein
VIYVEKYCQNPLCENEATKQVPVSVERGGDQKRSLCAVCEEVYTWGVQHGQMTATAKKVWVLAVTHKGTVVYTRACRKRRTVLQALVMYLEAHEGYRGPDDMGHILAWLAEHDERLGVDVFSASVDLS